MSERRGAATIAVMTDLWPSRSTPYSGAFVRAQVEAVAPSYRQLVLVPSLLLPRVHRRIWRDGLQGWQRGWVPPPDSARLVRYPFARVPRVGEAELRERGARLALLLSRERPALVHGHFLHEVGLAATRLARSLDLPSVVTVHGTDARWLLDPETPIRLRRRMTAALRLADRVVCVSRPIADGLAALDVPQERIRVLPMGVDPERFSPLERTAARALVGVPAEGRLVLFVGGATRAKGFDVLASALESLPDVACYAVGPAELASPRIHAVGVVPHARLAPWYSAADVLCLPSLAEGSPVSVVEALAAGTPVVASEVGGIPDQIEPGVNGYLVPPGDPQRLSDALAAALETPWNRERIRASSEQYWWSTVASRLTRLYDELIR